MIHELRVYRAVPGQMAKLQARFRDQLPPIWEKHGIHAIGFWTTLVGESSDQLTYILQWESLADLETRWTAFLNDPAWHRVRDEGERGWTDRCKHQQSNPDANGLLGLEIAGASANSLANLRGFACDLT